MLSRFGISLIVAGLCAVALAHTIKQADMHGSPVRVMSKLETDEGIRHTGDSTDAPSTETGYFLTLMQRDGTMFSYRCQDEGQYQSIAVGDICSIVVTDGVVSSFYVRPGIYFGLPPE